MGFAYALGVIAAIVCFAAWALHEGAEWERFSEAHECHKVGETSGTYIAGQYVPGKVAWACDDGVTYWR